MRRVIIFLCLLTLPAAAEARLVGRQLADSLLRELAFAREDSNMVKLLDSIALVFHNIKPDSGITYAGWAKDLAERLAWKRGIAKSYHALGLNYETKTLHKEALENYLKALKLFEETEDWKNMASTSGNIGNVYTTLGKFSQALEFDSIALKLYRQVGDKEGQVRNLGNMASVYQGMKDYTAANRYFTEARDMAEKEHLTAELGKNLGNLALLQYDQGDIRGAIRFTRQALDIYESEDYDQHGLAVNLSNMGEFYISLAAKEPASKTQHYNEAIRYINKSIAVSSSIQYNEGLIQDYLLLADVYEKMGAATTALTYYKRYFKLKDSVYSSNVAVQIADLEAKRSKELAEKQQEIANTRKASLEFKNMVEKFVYIPGIILLLVIVGVVTRNFLNQVRNNKQLAKEKNKHLQRIKVQSDVLMDIAYIQSHEVRGPVATMLGLSQLFNYDDLADPVNKELMEGIAELAQRLDKIVTEVVDKENKLMRDTLSDDES